ncbi:hypothetical protein TIFTF001_017252 [Ficus carica]|uniref:Uncharacterized protein n=1 Tax=Ficus carica TaxID=3494 RepID=A0AA88DJ01_FICCA|nr:hypothetical protein TIFTF001_017252 [Ficus carica]
MPAGGHSNGGSRSPNQWRASPLDITKAVEGAALNSAMAEAADLPGSWSHDFSLNWCVAPSNPPLLVGGSQICES